MKLAILAVMVANAATLVQAAPVNATSLDPLYARGNVPCRKWTEKIGNGNPHQNGLHLQVSDNFECREQGGCQVSEFSSHTVSFSADFGVDEWISGGFDVTESYETGDSYGCPGKVGETICVFKNIAHTAYTVQNYDSGDCLTGGHVGPIVVKSPNVDNKGGYFYCASGSQCHYVSYSFWNDSGP